MNIQLDDKYVITSDGRQFLLNKVGTVQSGQKKGEQVTTVVGFYGRIDHVLDAYVDEKVFDSQVTSIHELMELIKELRQFIKEVAY